MWRLSSFLSNKSESQAGQQDNVHPQRRPDWSNLSILSRNRLPHRSNFHLYNNEKDALARDITTAKALSLSGIWKFHLATSPFEAPSDFAATSFDRSQWEDIQVPGMWQLQGFGKGPHYTNIKYPFFVDPPHAPYTANECGSYATHFAIPREIEDHQLILRFDGVDSAFHVWINGKEVGYSQGSRNPAEFIVTPFVEKGRENLLAVRVYQFCDGSYIEDQDQWWLSGIFRDVSLLGFPPDAWLEDISVQTELDQHYKDATLKVQVELARMSEKVGLLQLKLLDASRKEVATSSKETTGKGRHKLDFSIPIENPRKWTAETPYLYDLVLSLDGTQFTAPRVGFRTVELKDGLIKVNGKRVVFKGANRHEHHPLHGRAVPFDFLLQDLRLMKMHNINAIRTCHQPSDPRLYDLADEMGFWVMDEADLECHGFEMVAESSLAAEGETIAFSERQRRPRKTAASWTSDNPDWHDAYLDRAEQVVRRDKLHPSVIVWSLGNESFYGRNHTAMRDWIKSYDPTRLIHYEPDADAEDADIYSRMYPHLHDIIAFAKDTKGTKNKPLVLCEYIHAMGTGPGNIKEYVDAFYEHPRLQGGWVWEWANHGLLTHTKNGVPYYGYGGDFGDVPNDYNFVMDGVLQSDHTPNSGLVEYKKALEPVQMVKSTKSSVTIINRLDFATLDHLTCSWKIAGETSARKDNGAIKIPPGIQPGATAELALPKLSLKGCGEVLIDLSFQLKEQTSWAEAGYELAWLQVPLTPPSPVYFPPPLKGSALKVEKLDDMTLKITGKESQWKIDLVRGCLSSWKKNATEMIAHAPEPSFYRAPTDNDAAQDGREWKERQMHLARVDTRHVSWAEKGGDVVLEMEQKFVPPVLSWSLDLKSVYTITSAGAVKIHIKGTPRGLSPPRTLPRIGMTLGMPKEFDRVEWFGRGPAESYKDMKLSQRVAVHSVESLDDLWMAPPEYPQECGNRTDTRWLKLSDGRTSLTAHFAAGGDPRQRELFDFMASHYHVGDIDAARHPHELAAQRVDQVILRLDADHHGLGTGSCGPKTLEQYALKTKEFEFEVILQ